MKNVRTPQGDLFYSHCILHW